MARHPVTKEAVLDYAEQFHGGIRRPAVTTGKYSETKHRIARKATGSAMGGMFRQRNAGMMIDFVQNSQPYLSGFRLDAYRTSYANGLDQRSGTYDIPTYFQQMNEQNGGVLYWPTTLQEKYQWYRYWARSDAYIGRSLELLSDLPMSKLTLSLPKYVPKKVQDEIMDLYTAQLEAINAFQLLIDILWETNMIGNCVEGHRRVYTPDGPLPICEIRNGDLVLTETGRYRSVVNAMRRKVSERLVVLDVARLKHDEWACTKEHPVFVLRDGELQAMPASQVRRGDFVSLWHLKEVVDVQEVSLVSDYREGLLDGRYDQVELREFEDSYAVDVRYKTMDGSSARNGDVRDLLLSWLSGLNEPVVADCMSVAETLGVDDPKRVRTAAYSFKRKGIIRTERTSKGRQGGSAIRWFPYDGDLRADGEYAREWERSFCSSVKKLEVTNDFMYVLGYWLGDGWLWKYKRPRAHMYDAIDICFERGSPCVEPVKDAMREVFGRDSVEYFPDGGYCNDELAHVVVEDVLLSEWWASNFGSCCDDKRIPEWVISLPQEKLLWMLRGLIDSDGCVHVGSGATASIAAKNKELAESIFRVGLQCGIPFSFTLSKRNAKLPRGGVAESEVYCLSMGEADLVRELVDGCVKEADVPHVDGQPYRNYIFEDGRFYLRVDDVGERFYDGFVYNIEVEDDHTYCVDLIDTHNCYIFHEWDEKKKMWSRAVVLPPEEVYIFEYPFSQNARVEYRPERLMSIIKQQTTAMDSLPGGSDMGTPGAGDCMRGNLTRQILEHIPEEIVKMVQEQGCIVMDTDPTTGSFVHHIARRKSPYLDLGASALERVLVPMLQKEHYRYTQLSLASRNMTPKNLITAEGLMPEELDDLRTQVDLSYMDPEYTIITNYPVTWEQIGAQDRLIDLTREYETIENQIFAALGVTRELLTGEGAFSGNKITVEILNTMFLLSREVLKDYLEKQLFKPIAEAHGWFTEDKNGIKKYWYPHVGFNRLTIRDNAEVFDSLFQLYQKGSLPVEVIYELFNLDADRMEEKLKKDLFTVNDATFNRLVEEVNSEVGRALVEKSDVVKRLVKYLGFKEQEAPSGEEGGFGGGFEGGFAEEEGAGGAASKEQPAADDEVDRVAEEVTSKLKPGASEEEVRKLVEERAG